MELIILGLILPILGYSAWAVKAMAETKHRYLTEMFPLCPNEREARFMVETFWDEIVIADARKFDPAYVAYVIVNTADTVIHMTNQINIPAANLAPQKRQIIKKSIRSILNLPPLAAPAT